MKKWFVQVVFLLLVSAFLFLSSPVSAADKFPSREIVIIVQFTAGGPIDLTTRALAEALRKQVGVPVIVEDRPEAGGVKGVVDVYKAKPDGYTLLANLFPRNAQAEIVYKAPYKILDMTYIGLYQRQDEIVAVRNDSPYKSIKDLVEASKKKPLTVSIAGMGSLDTMVLKRKVGVNLVVVPFKGSAPAMMALVGGNADLTVLDDLTVLLQKDKCRYLATFSEERSPKFPGVPTLKEMGYSVPLGYATVGIAGPPLMPESIRSTLEASVMKATQDPDYVKTIDKLGALPISSTGAQFKSIAESFYKFVKEYEDIFEKQK
jgi:tripartite-type tricarboxylate transporter receptor subunit TctC